MNTNSLIAAPSRVCRLPLAALEAPELNATLAGNTGRLVAGPVAPVMLYTRETLACMGTIPFNTPAGGGSGYFAPPREFGVNPNLVRIPRVMIIVYPGLGLSDPLLTAFETAYNESLAPLGVHAFLTSGSYVPRPSDAAFAPAATASMAAIAPLTAEDNVEIEAGRYEQRFEALAADGMTGGEVYWATLSADPYGLPSTADLSSTTQAHGYAIYTTQAKDPGDGSDFPDFNFTSFDVYAQVTDGTVASGRTRTTVYVSTTKAAADRLILEAYAQRCWRFRLAFWTGSFSVRANGVTIPGDVGGLIDQITDSSTYVVRSVLPTTTSGTSDIIDTDPAVAALVADAASFFSAP